MRWPWVLLACGGCNQLFGLTPTVEQDATVQVDARQFDAPIDGPLVCPPLGHAPQFSALAHPVVSRALTDYTFSGTAMIALGQNFGTGILQGPLDADLAPASGFLPPTAGHSLRQPRIAPEGDTAYVKVILDSNPSSAATIDRYTQVGGIWTHAATESIALGGDDFVGSVTRGPSRRIMVFTIATNPSSITEYASTGADTWAVVGTYDFSAFFSTPIDPYDPMMTSDGFRLVFRGSDGTGLHTYYSDRADLGSKFGPATALDGVAGSLHVNVLADDCSRLYLDATSSVFYLQEL